MRRRFHPLAIDELDAVVAYYEERREGLGLEFAREVELVIARIAEHPFAGRGLSRHTRRCLVNRFPYGVIYRVESDALWIVAVANLQRRPGYWKSRL